jgi:hypothetical protein
MISPQMFSRFEISEWWLFMYRPEIPTNKPSPPSESPSKEKNRTFDWAPPLNQTSFFDYSDDFCNHCSASCSPSQRRGGLNPHRKPLIHAVFVLFVLFTVQYLTGSKVWHSHQLHSFIYFRDNGHSIHNRTPLLHLFLAFNIDTTNIKIKKP